MLPRFIESSLQEELNNSPAVALLGPRQVGKTTLASNVMVSKNSLYLDLESPGDLLKLSDPLAFFQEHREKLIILDEIQLKPELFSVLRGVIDKNRAMGAMSSQFLLLGSASMDLLRQSSESLAGRISYVEMSGINLKEIAGEEDKTTDIKNLWLRGGFPDVLLSRSDNIAMRKLENLIRSYLERDIPQFGFKIPAARLRRLWTMLAHLQGETINYSTLASNLEVDRKTINHYLDILTDLLLVRRLQPFHANVKKRLVKSPRYYVRDSGILHRLLGINNYDALLSNPVLGKSWEGFVVENIHSVLSPLAESYFYRTAAGAEVDLVLKMPDSQIWAIEIKHGSSPKPAKHFRQTCEDIGASQRFIVYGGEDEFPIANNVRMMPLAGMMERISNQVY